MAGKNSLSFGTGSEVGVGVGSDGVGLTDSSARGVYPALRLSQVRLSRVDRVSYQRGGKGQHALLTYRARLPGRQVRTQAGDYMVTPRLLELDLTLATCFLRGSQRTLGSLQRGGGPVGGTPGGRQVNEKRSQLVEVASGLAKG